MNSYQKRKQEIKYLKQCIEELESLCLGLAKKAPKPIQGLGRHGVKGTDFITPYNNGEFFFRLQNTSRKP